MTAISALRALPSPADVALRYGQAKSRQDIPAALACCTDDFVLETIPFQLVAHGRAEVEQDLRLFFLQFPDYGFVPEGHAVGDASVVLWGRAVMTSTGQVPRELARPWERLVRLRPRRIDVPAVAVFEIRDGLLAREQFHFDMRAFCSQLGLPVWFTRSLLRRAERRRQALVVGARS
jgi:ketosteroid isomerase-like protein